MNHWRFGEQPLMFCGVPPLLRAHAEVINDTGEKLRAKGVVVRGEGATPIGGDVIFAERLPPHSRTWVNAHLAIDRATPPGIFRATVTGSLPAEVPATLHVYSRVSARVQPAVAHISGGSGDKIELPIVITNLGNIALKIRRVAALFFEEHNWVGRAAVFALRRMPPGRGLKKGDEAHGYADLVVDELRESLLSVTSIAFSSPASTLAPNGETEALLAFELPRGLVKGRTYGATLSIAGAFLAFHLECDRSETRVARVAGTTRVTRVARVARRRK